MSRGLGRVQQATLAYLRTDPEGRYGEDGPPGDVELHQVACAVFGTTEPTDAQKAATRRAVRSLAAAGLVRIIGRRSHADKCGPDDRFYEQVRWRGARGTRYRGAGSEVNVPWASTESEKKADR